MRLRIVISRNPQAGPDYINIWLWSVEQPAWMLANGNVSCWAPVASGESGSETSARAAAEYAVSALRFEPIVEEV